MIRSCFQLQDATPTVSTGQPAGGKLYYFAEWFSLLVMI